MNKHTLWHNIRTLLSGLFIIGLIPVPLILMGPSNNGSVGSYVSLLMICMIGVALSQVMVLKYRNQRDTSQFKQQKEKLYSYIGLGIILLFFVSILLLPLLSKLFQ